jgi:hypothetical protein
LVLEMVSPVVLMMRLKRDWTKLLAESVTRMVRGKVPAARGVPERMPLEARVRPWGRLPVLRPEVMTE